MIDFNDIDIEEDDSSRFDIFGHPEFWVLSHFESFLDSRGLKDMFIDNMINYHTTVYFTKEWDTFDTYCLEIDAQRYISAAFCWTSAITVDNIHWYEIDIQWRTYLHDIRISMDDSTTVTYDRVNNHTYGTGNGDVETTFGTGDSNDRF